MDKGLRPLPVLYACYLLRSTVRHASLYIGSTPDPVRRLKQHNGVSKGGAVRTSKDSLRPWEITCLVTGFPSKIAALQFEWAWQNTHVTRHIDAETRITQAKTKIRISPKSGRTRKRPIRPRMSLTDRIANLHLLLQACSFERWPLKVTFYVQDVYKMWQRWAARDLDPIASHIEVQLDSTAQLDAPSEDVAADSRQHMPLTGLAALPVDYGASKLHLQKSRTLWAKGSSASCAVCHSAVPSNLAGTVLCSGERCLMLAHVGCLSTLFLSDEGPSNALVPTKGHCPKCALMLNWIDLVRELSLRMRGEAELAKLFKPPRASKTMKGVAEGGTAVETAHSEDENLAEDEVWHNMSQSSMDIDDFTTPQKPAASGRTARNTFKAASNQQAPTIEDSDWDDAEVVT